MLAMRHRSPRGYQPVNTEDVDYDEDIHSIGNQLTNRSQKVIKANIIKSRNASGLYNIRLIQFYIFFNSTRLLTHDVLGAKVLVVFSLSGVLFLSSILVGVENNLLDIKFGESEGEKFKILQGIVGAILLYALCLGVSAYYWYKSIIFNEDYERLVS